FQPVRGRHRRVRRPRGGDALPAPGQRRARAGAADMNLLRGTFLLLALVSVPAFAAEGGLMHYDADLGDRASLQRGARLFVNYCLSCHSASYMRFNRLGRDLGIPEDVLLENLMFGTDKPGDTMTVAMQSADAERWFGVAAPDLSVTARARGDDWLYTYF